MEQKEKYFSAKRILSQGAGQFAVKLFISWLLTACFFLLKSSKPLTDFAFFKEINMGFFLYAFAVFFIALVIFIREKAATVLALVVPVFYAAVSSTGSPDAFFSAGLCIVCGIVIFAVNFKELAFKLDRKFMWAAVIAVMLFSAAFIGYFCSLYYKNHWTSCYDFGLFSQMFEYMKQTGLPYTTCERDGLLSHFAVHFSPIFYLMLPAFMLVPSPVTLLVMQGIIVASGAVPTVLICKEKKLPNLCGAVFALAYSIYSATVGGCFYYLHENCFLAPLILWTLFFALKGKNIPMFIFAVLTLSVKEDAAVYVAVIALYLFFTDKKKGRSIAMFALAVIYFIAVTKIMTDNGEGVMTWRYDNFMYDKDGNLLTVIFACIKNPAYVIKQCMAQDKIGYFLQMLLPLAFLPLITKRAERFILLIPFLLVNLMPNYSYQHNINFQYGFGSGAILIFMSIINFSDIKIKKEKVIACVTAFSVIFFAGNFWSHTNYIKSYKSDLAQRQLIDNALELVPKDSSVAASTFLVPNLYEHKVLYELETTKHKADYYVLDLRFKTEQVNVDDYLNSSDYEKIMVEDNVIAVLRRVN